MRKWSSVLVTRGSNQAFNPASGMPEPVAREESWGPRIRALKLEGPGAGLLSKKNTFSCSLWVVPLAWELTLFFALTGTKPVTIRPCPHHVGLASLLYHPSEMTLKIRTPFLSWNLAFPVLSPLGRSHRLFVHGGREGDSTLHISL